MTIRIGAALFVAFLIAADKPEDAVKKEQEKLKGTWVVESLQVGDEKIDGIKGSTIRFDGDKIFTKAPGEKEREGSYKIDPIKSPKEIDLLPRADEKEKITQRGIYTLDGDTLTIVEGTFTQTIDKNGKVIIEEGKRPTKFDPKLGGLMVLKREKK